MLKTEIVVVGAGIAGLTSAAILSKLGLSVTLIESHTQSGGCAAVSYTHLTLPTSSRV